MKGHYCPCLFRHFAGSEGGFRLVGDGDGDGDGGSLLPLLISLGGLEGTKGRAAESERTSDSITRGGRTRLGSLSWNEKGNHQQQP